MAAGPSGEWTVARAVQLAFSLYALVVFAVLWLGAAAVLLGTDTIADEAWRWVQSLPAVGSIAIWILFLPITIGLWAWHADLTGVLAIAIVAGLVAWTILPLVNLVQAVRGR